MKQFFTLLFAFFCLSFLQAQNQRLVLVEHFTQASCGPCAAVNPGFQALLNANKTKTVAIKYQTSWPGYDPMHDHNAGQIDARVRYYGVSAVPNTVLDGSGPGSTTSVVTQATIDSRYNSPAPFDIQVSHRYSDRLDEVFVTVEITANQAMDEPLSAQIAVVEEEINFLAAPGSNGERNFYSVMKKMLPSQDGTTLPSVWTAGQKETLNYSWKFENVYRLDEIAVVAFVQNPSTKAVHQAAYSAPNLAAAGPNDALIASGAGSGDFGLNDVCGNQSGPIVKIMNAGSDNLRNAKITYSINGGSEVSYNWSGNLAFLGTTNVTLPVSNFNAQGVNQITYRVSEPNGGDDANGVNDALTNEFLRSKQTSVNSKLEIKPASSPAKISWKLLDDQGNTIKTSNPYTTPFRAVTEDISFDPDRCYHFEFTNTASSLNGIARLYNAANEEVFKVEMTGGTIKQNFGTFDLTSTTSPVSDGSLKIFPNPAADNLSISFELESSADLNVEMVNTLGAVVLKNNQTFHAGKQQIELPVSGLAPGMYFVKIGSAKGQITKAVIVE